MTFAMRRILLTALAIFFAFFSFVQLTFAQQSGSQVADAQCLPQKGNCQYMKHCDGNPNNNALTNIGIVGKVCKDPRGVTGSCTSDNVCKATSAQSSTGKSMGVGDLSQLMSALSQLMKSLGGGGGGSGGGSGSGDTGSIGGTSGCVQYYPVSQPSADPCAYYVPSSGSSSINIDTGSGISNLIGNTDNSGENTDTGSNLVSNLFSNFLGGNTDSGTTSASSTGQNAGAVSSSTAQGATGVGPGGATGEIRVLPNGATIIISNENGQSNSVVAGFMGSQVTGGEATGLVAGWCRSRPWTSNFLSFIIPPTFFDNLCTLRGYPVGEVAHGPGATEIGTGSSGGTVQSFTTTPAGTSSAYQPIPQSPPIQANIWAVPPAVPLGGRTTIYWNSKNASSCIETSPDGSFSHTSISGGGATVPLSGATVFTISCTAPDGTHVTHDMTVNISI